jgi:hypothetical protein
MYASILFLGAKYIRKVGFLSFTKEVKHILIHRSGQPYVQPKASFHILHPSSHSASLCDYAALVLLPDALVFFTACALLFVAAGLRLALPILVTVVRRAGLGRGWLFAMKEHLGKGPWLLSPAVEYSDAYM